MEQIFYHVEFTIFFVNKKTFSDYLFFDFTIKTDDSVSTKRLFLKTALKDIDEKIKKATKKYIKEKDLEEEKGYEIKRIQKFPFKLI